MAKSKVLSKSFTVYSEWFHIKITEIIPEIHKVQFNSTLLWPKLSESFESSVSVGSVGSEAVVEGVSVALSTVVSIVPGVDPPDKVVTLKVKLDSEVEEVELELLLELEEREVEETEVGVELEEEEVEETEECVDVGVALVEKLVVLALNVVYCEELVVVEGGLEDVVEGEVTDVVVGALVVEVVAFVDRLIRVLVIFAGL